MGDVNNREINLTTPEVRREKFSLIESDIVLIGVPVYEERIPKVVYSYLTELRGVGQPVVLIGVYGNIGEGIVLNELDLIARNSGFKVIASATFIGEHSFSTKETHIASNRPNIEDLRIAEEFGKSIIKILNDINNVNEVSHKVAKGKLPLMAKIAPENSARLFTKTPIVDREKCNRCNLCLKLCPMGAIDNVTLEINEEDCLRCFSCVKRCIRKARAINYKTRFLVKRVLRMKNRIQKEPKIYL